MKRSSAGEREQREIGETREGRRLGLLIFFWRKKKKEETR
jgi:hypothetical protein